MPAVFVHGVPETASVWMQLIEHLDREDVVTLELPGFGNRPPPAFDPTMDAYAEWLAAELGAHDEPIDLVAHDWGGLLALRTLAGQPPNIRSWVVDVPNLEADLEWHDMARLWQTPGDGEAFVDGFVNSSIEERAAMLVGSGVPESGAVEMAARIDATMGAAILRLYRSAVDIGTAWGPGLDDIIGRGLVIGAGRDPYSPRGGQAKLAERTGARLADQPDLGHFWMLEAPAECARVLRDFWAGPDGAGLSQ